MPFLVTELIRKKRDGGAHSKEEIEFLVQGFTKNQIPDYQMSAWLMAVVIKGFSSEETHNLTQSMLHSGDIVDFSSLGVMRVDKHSTGGVGDKTSLVLAPIVAAAGVAVPMISGRGLGHTGGTLDKLESIPGFNTQVTLPAFKKLVAEHFLCFIGQTLEICPADKKIYSLRDTTGTVESIPLICASIMSKKLAEGINGLVLDVKFGSGAFMKTQAQARELAEALLGIAKSAGKSGAAFITNMNQPLGRFIGNSLEIRECVEILSNKTPHNAEDTRELSLQLAGAMIWLGNRASSLEQGYKVAAEMLTSGLAHKKFLEVCEAQGGNLSKLPEAKHKLEIESPLKGYISEINTEFVGLASIVLGAGRKVTSDKIDPTAGIEIHKKIGDQVQKSDKLFTLYGNDKARFEEAKVRLLTSVKFSEGIIKKPSLIVDQFSTVEGFGGN